MSEWVSEAVSGRVCEWEWGDGVVSEWVCDKESRFVMSVYRWGEGVMKRLNEWYEVSEWVMSWLIRDLKKDLV